MTRERTIKVFEILYVSADEDSVGVAGDGSFIFRTRDAAEAKRFAGTHEYMGRPCSVGTADVPARIARRWGLA